MRKETMIDILQHYMTKRGAYFPWECLEHEDISIVGLSIYGWWDLINDTEENFEEGLEFHCEQQSNLANTQFFVAFTTLDAQTFKILAIGESQINRLDVMHLAFYTITFCAETVYRMLGAAEFAVVLEEIDIKLSKLVYLYEDSFTHLTDEEKLLEEEVKKWLLEERKQPVDYWETATINKHLISPLRLYAWSELA